MSYFDRIAQAIRFLSEHAGQQPSLAQLAAHLGLSPFHVQRLFRRWAGVTPKQFLQLLTVQRARELLASVGLHGFEDKYPHELSGGMRQRVSICRALIHNPEHLLMDEPFGALDSLTRDQLGFDLLEIWNERRMTVLFITHSITEAVFLSDRVIVMTPRPGQIDRIIDIDLPRPRTLGMRETQEFAEYSREILALFLERGVLSEGKKKT